MSRAPPIIGHRFTNKPQPSRPELGGEATGSRDPERRQLTTLFCDMVDSAALVSRLDPEDLREIMQSYLDVCTEIISALGGHVACYMGDGVLGFFGYPLALEDAAERAVRAGFRLIDATRDLGTRAGLTLQARVGVATGLVVVGDQAHPDLAYGGPLPLANRLQSSAEPETLLISDSTRRLLGSLFELRDLGQLAVKGLGEVTAWQVIGPAQIESRFAATRVASERPIIGRTQEMGLLLDRWQMARDGRPQTVLISGEAGIGKSCLVESFVRGLEGESYKTLRLNCAPLHADSPLQPVLGAVEKVKGEPCGESLRNAVPELAYFAGGVDQQAAGVFGASAIKRRVLDGLLDWLAGLARESQILVVVEDAHWIDPTTHELIGQWVRRVDQLRALMLVTYRPEFEPQWGESAHITRLSMSPLEPGEVRALAARTAGDIRFADEIAAEIVAKADGVPLYVEEFTKDLLESGRLREENGRLVQADRRGSLALPSTLQDSLLARLDRLGPVREVAQIASGIGRDFSRRLLARICPLPAPALDAALEQLLEAGILHYPGGLDGGVYQFKHALLAEAAYGALLHGRKRELHAQIARAFQEEFPDLPETQPELLAHHLTEAGFRGVAIDWWEKAALLAGRRGAHMEVTRHLGRALDLLEKLPQGRMRDEREMALRLTLRRPLMFAKGYNTREADPNYERLMVLGEALGRTEATLGVLNGWCIQTTVRCDYSALAKHARRLIELANAKGDPAGEAVGYFHLAVGSLYSAQLEQSLLHVAALQHVYSADLRAASIRSYNLCPGLTVRGVEALALQFTGFSERARDIGLAAVAESRAFGDAATHLIVLHRVTLSRILDGDLDHAEAFGGELAALAKRNDVRTWSAAAPLFVRWVEAKRRGLDKPLLDPDLDLPGEPERYWSYYLLLDAELLIAAGRHAEAGRRLDLSEALLARTNERLFAPELLRLRAVAARAAGSDAQELDRRFDQALTAAREVGVKFWHLRTATDCAEYWRDTGRNRAALQLLRPIYASYAEGFDTPPLCRAREVLDTLG